jgi:signal transduction histidine kinase
VRVQVEDEGVGFEPGVVMGAGASSGLHGIRERALLLGGDYEFKSAPGRGARITVDLPLPPSRSGLDAKGTP